MSNLGSGHGLLVFEFEPCMGLAAVSAEPASDPVSLPLCPSHCRTVSKINKNVKKVVDLQLHLSQCQEKLVSSTTFVWGQIRTHKNAYKWYLNTWNILIPDDVKMYTFLKTPPSLEGQVGGPLDCGLGGSSACGTPEHFALSTVRAPHLPEK